MTRTLEMPCRFALVLIVVAAATGILALSAVAQTGGSSARKRTPPPAGSAEKWVGMYAGQDRQGKIVPPGFKVLVTSELRDDEKLVPHEPDVVEVVTPLLQPWALARANATDYELEDAGVICRPTGLLRPNQTSPFELLVSPEKITVFSTGAWGGINASASRSQSITTPSRPSTSERSNLFPPLAQQTGHHRVFVHIETATATVQRSISLPPGLPARRENPRSKLKV